MTGGKDSWDDRVADYRDDAVCEEIPAKKATGMTGGKDSWDDRVADYRDDAVCEEIPAKKTTGMIGWKDSRGVTSIEVISRCYEDLLLYLRL